MGYLQHWPSSKNWIFPLIVASGLAHNVCLLLKYSLKADNMYGKELINEGILVSISVGQIFMFGFVFLLSWWLTGIFGEEKYGWAKEGGGAGDGLETRESVT
jgi:hypothetical protein